MTPKQKCDELIKKYKPIVTLKMGFEHSYILKKAKQCALIAVDLILTEHPMANDYFYWQEVKHEIEKL